MVDLRCHQTDTPQQKPQATLRLHPHQSQTGAASLSPSYASPSSRSRLIYRASTRSFPDNPQVNVRPGLQSFLKALAETCDVVVFTAAMPDYAGPVLDRLDPTGRLISKRLYRSSCRQVRGAFLKDLSALGMVFEKHPGRCVLLDNNPCSFLCQPTNGELTSL